MTGDLAAVLMGCMALALILGYHIRRKIVRREEKEKLIRELQDDE